MKPKILVLDDQEQYLRSLARALRGEYELTTASTKQGAKAALTQEIDAVLTDIRLDESTDDDRQGLDFIRSLRVNYPDIPVVAMSALDVENIEADALAAGATRFLRKPIVISNLKRVLEQLLQGVHR